ncbi:MAG: RsmD family RNA methyltransferase, partial [Longimicrobiales bacterium]
GCVMRIIGGRWAGRELVSPGARVRPTAEPVRGRWIALLAAELPGARVLELYAGTGAVGLEALSRGARRVDFVENGAAAIHALKANVAALRATRSTRIFDRDALRFIERLDPDAYEIALADPPYGSKQTERLVERWLDAPFSRVLAVEHAAGQRLPGRARRHAMAGAAELSIFRTRSPHAP